MLSVIICTHNPREDYLRRTLEGLKAQTLPTNQWEFLLIDNRSDPPLGARFDLSWHPDSKIVVEAELGLTPARITGMRASRGDVLVFVDDDNILDRDFLKHVIAIATEHPLLGAWGGCIRPEFEELPDETLKGFLPALALREFSTDKWSNFSGESEPCGAGMCVRRAVALRYQDVIANSPLRRSLDRRGTNLSSAGDTDIAQTAYDLGLGTGEFVRLQVIHLIPRNRVQAEYLFRIMENSAYSTTLLGLAKGKLEMPSAEPPAEPSLKRRLWSAFVKRVERPFTPDLSRTVAYRWAKGVARAREDFRRSEASGNGTK